VDKVVGRAAGGQVNLAVGIAARHPGSGALGDDPELPDEREEALVAVRQVGGRRELSAAGETMTTQHYHRMVSQRHAITKLAMKYITSAKLRSDFRREVTRRFIHQREGDKRTPTETYWRHPTPADVLAMKL